MFVIIGIVFIQLSYHFPVVFYHNVTAAVSSGRAAEEAGATLA